MLSSLLVFMLQLNVVGFFVLIQFFSYKVTHFDLTVILISVICIEIFPLFCECVQSQRVPTVKNGFKQGMKLEGIDPQHPSMYFVLTVAEVSHASVAMVNRA